MIEEAVKLKTCPKCDAEVRPNTQFCYNCGASLTVSENGKGNNFSVAGEKILEEQEIYKTGSLKHVTETAEIKSKPLGNPKINSNLQAVETKSPNLKSAVPKRERPKKIVQKEVKVYWEDYENKSNLGFILATIIMTVFAAVVVYLMLQIK